MFLCYKYFGKDSVIVLSWTEKRKGAVSIYMHSIFSLSGATETDKSKSSARDRLSLHSSVVPPTRVQPPSSIDHLIEDLFPFFISLTSQVIHLSPSFFFHLFSHSNSFTFLLSIPLSCLLSFIRETLTIQSRFASYFDKPLKASHFRMFHREATHQLCHSHRRVYSSHTHICIA